MDKKPLSDGEIVKLWYFRKFKPLIAEADIMKAMHYEYKHSYDYDEVLEILKEARNRTKTNVDEIANQNAGQLAEWLHATYEEISKTVGWKTQESCQTKFKDLPEKNRSVMLRVAQRIQVEKLVPLVVENINLKKQLKEAEVEKYSKVMQ